MAQLSAIMECCYLANGELVIELEWLGTGNP